jgi:hypothetical protein
MNETPESRVVKGRDTKEGSELFRASFHPHPDAVAEMKTVIAFRMFVDELSRE